MGEMEKAAVLMIKGAISDLDKDDQDAVKECHDKLEELYKSYGINGQIALALLGAEVAAQEE